MMSTALRKQCITKLKYLCQDNIFSTKRAKQENTIQLCYVFKLGFHKCVNCLNYPSFKFKIYFPIETRKIILSTVTKLT